MSKKIGIGIVTYNAPERLKRSAFTVPDGIDKFVIVNDGTGHLYTSDCYPKHAEVIQHSRNLSVGCAKNTALRTLIQEGCEHLFIMEDDILIKNSQVFEAYIKASEKTGNWHLLYAYHGPGNFLPDGKTINPRQVIDYGDGIEIALNQHCVGAFSTYTKGMIRHVGYHDERFNTNSWEHIELSLRIVKAGMAPAYWWWPDIAQSCNYLQEIASSTANTVIPHTKEWNDGVQTRGHLFKHLHGYYPTQMPDTSPEEVLKRMDIMQQNYAKK